MMLECVDQQAYKGSTRIGVVVIVTDVASDDEAPSRSSPEHARPENAPTKQTMRTRPSQTCIQE